MRTSRHESVASFNRRLDRERAVEGAPFQQFWCDSTRRRFPALMALHDAAEAHYRAGKREFYFRGRRYRLSRSVMGQMCLRFGDALLIIGPVGEPEAGTRR